MGKSERASRSGVVRDTRYKAISQPTVTPHGFTGGKKNGDAVGRSPERRVDRCPRLSEERSHSGLYIAVNINLNKFS